LRRELATHLKDSETYQIISIKENLHYVSIQLKAVQDAVNFYGQRLLLVVKPSNRYIYFLPKIHEDIQDWRSTLHPKMRPIISDTCSITSKLAKHILPHLQYIESKINSTVTSSLAVVDNIAVLNETKPFTNTTQIATIDVESLFTKIPQSHLLDIVNASLLNYFDTSEKKQKFMHYLQTIISFNTFQVNDNFCLQKIGLPMGGPLSGTLANIYLGFTEKSIIDNPGILLYNRYMDDILVICNFSDKEIEKFILTLQSTVQLNMTASYNKQSVNFLDMSIFLSHQERRLEIHPYSKRQPHFPVPSVLSKRSITMDANIIKSQILRVYRLSTNSQSFTASINTYLRFLQYNKYYKSLRKRVFTFLRPVSLCTHKWTADIHICYSCKRQITTNKVTIKKILKVDMKYLAIKEPLNCRTMSIHIVIQKANVNQLIWVPSLHDILINKIASLADATILPIGVLGNSKLKGIISKHPTIQYSNKDILQNIKENVPCFLHHIFETPEKVYGIQSCRKKTISVGKSFNIYKKVSRNWKTSVSTEERQ
jgi:hypothetical protein